MVNFTEPQIKALTAAFERNGALYARGSSRMGGAFRRCAERLVDQGYLNENAPFPITMKGLVALRDIRVRKFGVSGCEAHRLDLEKVEAAMAEFPSLAARAERQIATAGAE